MTRALRKRLKHLRRRFGRSTPAGKADRASSSGAAPPVIRPYTSLLPPGSNRTIVLIAHPSLRTQVNPWLLLFANDQCHIISSDAAPEWALDRYAVTFHAAQTGKDISWEIKLIGSVDVLVNLLPRELFPQDVSNHDQMWRRLYLHLKPDGLYIVDCAQPPEDLNASVSRWVETLGETAEAGPPGSSIDAEMSRSISDAAVARDLTVLRKRGRHYVKLRDSETNRVLPAREPRIAVRELALLPAGRLLSRANVTSHEASVPIERFPESLEYPPLHLRHYTGRLTFSGSSLMYGENSILPDSFRHHLSPNTANFSNARITNVSYDFARIPAQLHAKDTVDGNYYQLDSTFSGHYGHFTTEVLSKIWGWDQAKQAVPELRVILRRRPNMPEPTFEREFLKAYGISADDICWTDRPVYLQSVVSASPMWHNEVPFYAHPDLLDIWRRLRDSLVGKNEDALTDRIFVSRGGQWDRRNCRNSAAVETFFAEFGFEIVYPEELSVPRQASIFAGASVIAGFAGSAMFNMLFADKLKTAIILSQEAYTARNEHLFTSLLGAEVHYFWSTPDVAHPTGRWSQEAFYSDWEFDFDRNEQALRTLITSL